MYIHEKGSRGSELIPLETKLMSDRIVFIVDEINPESACEFMKQILVMNQSDTDAAIRVLINSPGGEINAGMLMYDLIQASEAPIQTFCTGRAYSMAALLFACATHGRYMLPHSELMLHEPLLGSGVTGNASSIKSISDSLIETRSKMNKIIANHTGKTEKQVEKASCFDHFFTAQESLDFGLCDEIIEFDRIMKGD